METLLDAYALIALLRGEREPASVQVLDLLSGVVHVTTVNLAEVVDQLTRVDGIPGERLRSDLAPVIGAGRLVPLELGEPDAWLACALRAQHYHRDRCALSLADCFLLAAGKLHGAAIATADPAIAATARKEDIALIPLPDLRGLRP
jgi:PIN domain nuclease of toxin-antitoxin system